MAKDNVTITTTIKEYKEIVKNEENVNLIDFFSYLDTLRLKRAEYSFYSKHYKEYIGKKKSLEDWNKIIKLIHTDK